MAALNDRFFPRGALARDGWESVVDGELPDWTYTGLHVAELDGETAALPAGAVERIVIPLSGTFEVAHQGDHTTLQGRRDVFHGPTDVLYVGVEQALSVTGTGRVAVASAPATVAKPSRHVARSEVPVEIRGAGRSTRQIHNFGIPGALDAAVMIVCEVVTPAGNWSSHPAHKHDQAIAGVETALEEIYYFECAPARGLSAPASGADAFASFATYSSVAGEIEIRALVRTGDVALVPYGYHGPAAAPPEYDLYYLNVMAGPGPEREWRFTDDPRQTWMRSTWGDLEPDPRLPYERL